MTDFVPLVDLQAQLREIRPLVDAAIAQQLDRGDFICGQALNDFEAAFARYCGAEACIGVASGTAALTLALRAVRLAPGDEVVIPANTFAATAFAVLEAGATPVLVDIDDVSSLLMPAALDTVVNDRTRAVIPVHLFGRMCNMAALKTLAERHGLFVLEDACQAHGAMRDGRRAGAWGHAAAFSFYPSKNLGALGDGGAVTTSDQHIAAAVRTLRNVGAVEKYQHDIVAPNERLDTLQAAVLGVKLRRLDDWNAARRRAATAYTTALAGLPLICPAPDTPDAHVYHLYVVRLEDEASRNALRASLTAAGVATGIHYPIPLPELAALRGLIGPADAYPVACAQARTMLSLPMFPEITPAQIDQVVSTIRTFFGEPG